MPELLDVVLEDVAITGGAITVAHPADWQILREADAEHGRDAPYWAILWPSGEALADEVARNPPPSEARVLELGCGLALPSVAAARAGAVVLATDSSADAVAFAAHTLALDGRRGEVAVADWREPGPLLEGGPWDLVLAADVLYLQRNVKALQDLLPKLVGPGSEVWLADPGRTGAAELLAWAPERFEVSSAPSPLHEAVTIHRLRAR
jgi:predicted nicotinamide N-methyase